MSEQTSRRTLLADEWDVLSAFGLKSYQADEPFAVESYQLLDDDICLDTLQKIMPELGAPNVKITASLVIKRMAFLTLAPVLYAMSGFDKGLDGTLANCVFEYPLENRLWLSKMPLKDTSAIHWTAEKNSESRDDWRETILHKVFAENLTLLVEQLYALTNVSKRVLWENIAVRVFSIYEQRILKTVPEEKSAQAERDYEYLLDSSTTALFGMKENPLTPFYREKQITALSDKPVRVRRTCCFYYQATEPAEYCGNCPLPLRKACHRAKVSQRKR